MAGSGIILAEEVQQNLDMNNVAYERLCLRLYCILVYSLLLPL